MSVHCQHPSLHRPILNPNTLVDLNALADYLFHLQQEFNENKDWLYCTDHIPVASVSLDRTLPSPTGTLVLVLGSLLREISGLNLEIPIMATRGHQPSRASTLESRQLTGRLLNAGKCLASSLKICFCFHWRSFFFFFLSSFFLNSIKIF